MFATVHLVEPPTYVCANHEASFFRVRAIHTMFPAHAQIFSTACAPFDCTSFPALVSFVYLHVH
ncbi:hypothetical protein PsorP6_003651 [Peronosclerospora sorghi]|uniref:Uncharacterized protein n=1 Tax=Peronosclerospora sorghi TaxID=230839 RepID=A0ACC0VR49_9STRA|nr:hypothetical protein PsorP6_003651 [Peronosclerospora sorghi]